MIMSINELREAAGLPPLMTHIYWVEASRDEKIDQILFDDSPKCEYADQIKLSVDDLVRISKGIKGSEYSFYSCDVCKGVHLNIKGTDGVTTTQSFQ